MSISIPNGILVPLAYVTAFQTVLFFFLIPWLADAEGGWRVVWEGIGWLSGILDWLCHRKRKR